MRRSLALLTVLGSVGIVPLLLLSSQGSQAGAAYMRRQGPLGATVTISEVAWSGTTYSHDHEWIELYNNADVPLDLFGWRLRATDGSPNVALSGIIPARGFFLLERIADTTVSNIPADLIYSGVLQNDGDGLELLDASGEIVDSANSDGGAWPAGLLSPRHSMERVDPAAPGSDANWSTNDGLVRNGLDQGGNPINGTPNAPNSVWVLARADLRVDKRGPLTVTRGAWITYTIALSNAGYLPAESVWLTDRLPAQVRFRTHTAPYPFSQPAAGTLVWEVGTLPTSTAGAPITFTIVALVESTAGGALVNVVSSTTTSPESHPADNYDALITTVGSSPSPQPVLLDALYYDGQADLDHDEAVRLMNVSTRTLQLDGWNVTDQVANAGVTFPPGTSLAPAQAIWCTRNATAFEQRFGFRPDFETDGADPAVPDLAGSWPVFANQGGACLLRNKIGEVVDAVAYSLADPAVPGWNGPSVEPWTPSNYFPSEGQILYRKRDQATGLPQADTDSAADWAQDPADQVNGRKVQYPGWDLDSFFWTTRITNTAVLTVAVGPDHLLETILAQVERARESIWIEGYTLESAALADALVERLGAGVAVTILLEGGPAGGMDPAQRWICGQIEDAGGRVYFMHTYLGPARYRYQHAKVLLIDDRLVLIGSENLNPTGMPADDKSDGTVGRRGAYLITDAPGVVSHVRALLAADIDPAHQDLVTCEDVPELCTGISPLPEENATDYTVVFSEPLAISGTFAFEIVQSPENSLRSDDGLLGLVGQAKDGDTIVSEQFYEHVHWGPADGTPQTDPNPRLEAYVAAARRGATVRILLNDFAFGDYENENANTVAYLTSLARAEGLNLQARLGNPTYLGVHNKMVLAHIDNRGYVHVGSLNGSEVSSKVNREVAIQVQSDAAFEYLQGVFDYDWLHSPLYTYLPTVVRGYRVPAPADHLLISELFYAVSKEEEWVEILNPTGAAIDLSGYSIGDAEEPDTYEGMVRFPPGAALGSRQVLVVAASAAAFRQEYGWSPAYEIYETDLSVPNLTPSPSWGTGEWELRRDGDQVLLLDGRNQAVDVVVYGDVSFPGTVPHPGVSLFTHSLERYPSLFDTDDCSLDFRDWPFPNPGDVPTVGLWSRLAK